MISNIIGVCGIAALVVIAVIISVVTWREVIKDEREAVKEELK